MTCQRQQPIMFPYPYLQSSPKMQAKAKAQLFVFENSHFFRHSFTGGGGKHTLVSKSSVYSHNGAHILFWFHFDVF